MTGELDLQAIRRQIGEVEVLTTQDLAPSPGEKHAQLNVRVSPSGLDAIRRAAEKMGLEQSDLVRRAIAEFIRRFHADRRRELERLRGLSEGLASEARQIFAQLPENELGPDEPMHFSADQEGHLLLSADRTGDVFLLHDGCAVKFSQTSATMGLMVIYRAGEVIESRDFSLVEFAAFQLGGSRK